MAPELEVQAVRVAKLKLIQFICQLMFVGGKEGELGSRRMEGGERCEVSTVIPWAFLSGM